MPSKIKAAFHEPWWTDKLECKPFVNYPIGTTTDEEKAEVRAVPEQDNWLIWADRNLRPSAILAWTKPIRGDAGLGKKVAHRIVQCVNACAGMRDPGEGIARAKDVLLRLLKCEDLEEFRALEGPALSALSRLIPKEEECESDRPE